MLNVYTNSTFYRHDTGIGHPETARRLDAALEGVRRAGLDARIIGDAPRHPETERIIRTVHEPQLEDDLERACRAGMRLFHSIDNPISSASFAAAREAVPNAPKRWDFVSSTRSPASPNSCASTTASIAFSFSISTCITATEHSIFSKRAAMCSTRRCIAIRFIPAPARRMKSALATAADSR